MVFKNYVLISRTILSALHFNYNLQREDKVDDNGNHSLRLTYTKYKEGEATVRPAKTKQNYGNYSV